MQYQREVSAFHTIIYNSLSCGYNVRCLPMCGCTWLNVNLSVGIFMYRVCDRCIMLFCKFSKLILLTPLVPSDSMQSIIVYADGRIHNQGLFCVWAQPVRADVAVRRRPSLAEPIHRMIPDNKLQFIFCFGVVRYSISLAPYTFYPNALRIEIYKQDSIHVLGIFYLVL